MNFRKDDKYFNLDEPLMADVIKQSFLKLNINNYSISKDNITCKYIIRILKIVK